MIHTVLDYFNRNENPLSYGGRWARWTPATNTGTFRAGNGAFSNVDGVPSVYWTESTFGPNCNVDVIWGCSPSEAQGHSFFIGLRMTTPDQTSWNGYFAVIDQLGVDQGRLFALYRSDGGVYTQLDQQPLASDHNWSDEYGLSAEGSTFRYLLNFTPILNPVTDATYSGAGAVGFGGQSWSNSFFYGFAAATDGLGGAHVGPIDPVGALTVAVADITGLYVPISGGTPNSDVLDPMNLTMTLADLPVERVWEATPLTAALQLADVTGVFSTAAAQSHVSAPDFMALALTLADITDTYTPFTQAHVSQLSAFEMRLTMGRVKSFVNGVEVHEGGTPQYLYGTI